MTSGAPEPDGPIEFYFDFISPYGYLASTQIEALARRYQRTVDWKPVLLGVTVLKVMGLKPLMQTPLKSDYLRHDKPRMARLLGVPLAHRDMTGVNSLKAMRVFLWLKESDVPLAKRYAQRIYERLWVHAQDITSDDDACAEVASLGIDPDAARAALGDENWKIALRKEVEEAVSRNVFGTPFFIVDAEPLWGVDRLWMLEHWLKYRSWDPASPAG